MGRQLLSNVSLIVNYPSSTKSRLFILIGSTTGNWGRGTLRQLLGPSCLVMDCYFHTESPNRREAIIRHWRVVGKGLVENSLPSLVHEKACIS